MFKIENQAILLTIYAKPNAKKSALLTVSEDALHIALHAKPQDGKANQELIRFLAQLLMIPKTQISLLRGEHGRHKQIKIPLTNTTLQLLEKISPCPK